MNLGFCRVEIIAKLFGLSVRRIQQLTQEGIIDTVKTKEGRRYEFAPTVQKYIAYLSDKAHGKSKSERELDLKEQKLQAEIALKESQGELHRLKTDITAGKYIDIEEVKTDYIRFFIAFKKFAISLPIRLIARVNGLVDPVELRTIEKELTEEVLYLINSFIVAGVEVEETEKNN